MDHVDIINYLIDKNNYQSYLEIGLGNGRNFLKVRCKIKECVDPYEWSDDRNESDDINEFIKNEILTYRMTSDEFFNRYDNKYDLIFIDGLHLEEQVDRDIINSLKHLNKGGKIVVHDCLPLKKEHQAPLEERPSGTWNGTTWKSIPKLSLLGVNFYVVNTDTGCAVIDYRENPETISPLPAADYDYDNVFGSEFIKTIMLRIISKDIFLQIY